MLQDLTILFFSALCAAFLIKTPNNNAVIAGQRMEMECRTNNESIFRKWSFLSVASDSLQTIVISDKTNVEVVSTMYGFGVNADHSGSVVLYSESTMTENAGVYVCQGETGSTEFKYSAQLVVFESEPICETNLTADMTSSYGENIWMQCRVNFRGNWAPTMEWRQHQTNGDIKEGRPVINGTDTVVVKNSSITSTLIVLIDSTNYDSYYSCRTYFTWHNGTLRTDATNVPDFSHTWLPNSTTVLTPRTRTSADDDNEGPTGTGKGTGNGIGNADKILLYICLALVIGAIAGLFACRRTGAHRKILVVSRSTSMSITDSFKRQRVLRRRINDTISTANSDIYERIEDFNTTDTQTSIKERRPLPLPIPYSVPNVQQSILPVAHELFERHMEQDARSENSNTQNPLRPCTVVSVIIHPESAKVSAAQPTSGAAVDLPKALDSEENTSAAKADCSEIRKVRFAVSSSQSSDEEMPSSYLRISNEHLDLVPKVSISSI